MAQRVCPWWLGYFLANPVRRLAHNPRKMFAAYIRPGATVMDIGPGMASFTLDLARFTGPTGKVIAVDIQARMLEQVRKRAAKAGLLDRIETLLAGEDGAWARGIAGRVDFALAFYMVHEVSDAATFLALVRSTLAPGGRLLVVEPKMHVSESAYAGTVDAALKAGFKIVDSPKIRQSRTMLLS
ncbi:MAG: class I SAM-dependent methyltransferase [Candidatus Krumholzibacteriaceae bacterium]|jgi:ubiquinone/menaquinone biosynthesis C-methylase UbiE